MPSSQYLCSNCPAKVPSPVPSKPNSWTACAFFNHGSECHSVPCRKCRKKGYRIFCFGEHGSTESIVKSPLQLLLQPEVQQRWDYAQYCSEGWWTHTDFSRIHCNFWKNITFFNCVAITGWYYCRSHKQVSHLGRLVHQTEASTSNKQHIFLPTNVVESFLTFQGYSSSSVLGGLSVSLASSKKCLHQLRRRALVFFFFFFFCMVWL